MVSEYMKELGYSNEDIDSIINSYCLNSYLDESLYIKVRLIFNYFLEFGFSREDIISITRRFPILYSYSLRVLDMKNKMFIGLGITKEEFIRQIIAMPSIYGLSCENIILKRRFYEKIGIFDLVVSDLKNYILYSLDLVYARYMFYRTIGIKINKSNYKLLFVREKVFINKYGKNNKILMELYNFNEFRDKKKVRK